MSEDKSPKLFEDSNEKTRRTNLRPVPENISDNESKLHKTRRESQHSWLILMGGFSICGILATCIFGKTLLLSLAALAVESNQLNLADSIYDTSKALYPADFEVLRGRGMIKTILGDFNAALADDTHAIALRTNDARVYANRGFVRYKTHDDLGAIEDFSKVIALEPSTCDIYVRRGVVYARLGKYASAVKDFDKAMKIDPSNAEAMSYRSWALDQQDNISMERTASNDSPQKRRLQQHRPKLPDMNSTVEQVPHFGMATNERMIAIPPHEQAVPHPLAVRPAVGTAKILSQAREQRAGPVAPPTVASSQLKNYSQPGYPLAARQPNGPVVAHVAPLSSANMIWPAPHAAQKQSSAVQPEQSSSPEEIAIWAKHNYIKSFPRGWEMRGNDRVSFGPYALCVRNGELMITNNSEICWLSGSNAFYPKDAVDVKVSLADDGCLTLSAMNRDHVWRRYWWTVFDKPKQRPGPAIRLAFYEDEPLVCILDQNDVPLWHNPEQTHVSLSSMPPALTATAPSHTMQENRSAAVQVPRSAPVNHTGNAMLLIPVGASSLALEADQTGSRDGMLVYPETANNSLTQKWIVERKQPNVFAIHPAFDRTLALTVVNGRFADGTKVIVSRDRGYSTQTWSFVNISGKYSVLRPLCAPNLVLDNAGGPHTQVDLLRYTPGNVNTLCARGSSACRFWTLAARVRRRNLLVLKALAGHAAHRLGLLEN